MKLNLLGELEIMKSLNTKPNFSALAREYGMDRRTVKKYYEGYRGKPPTRNKPSKLDEYAAEIIDRLQIKRVTISGVYNFMITKYGIDNIGSYSNFRTYIKKNKLMPKETTKGHPRVETTPGFQAQVDWKEDVILYSKHGEKFVINIFHVVLGYSRYDFLELSFQKRSEDVIRGLINSFRFFGGVPKEILFDNMPTAATINGRHKKVNGRLALLAKDFGFKVRLCKARHPQTKGLVEAKNKMLDWIRAYNGEFETAEDLISIIEEIQFRMNTQIHQDIGLSPTALFYKEKEYLMPLPSRRIIENYLQPNRYTVSNEALIRFGGNKYSVSPELINQQVTIETFDNKLYIYYNGKLVTLHHINNKPINYHQTHYTQLMKGKVSDKDLMASVTNNLSIMDRLLDDRQLNVSLHEATMSNDALIAYLNTSSSGKWIINRYARMRKNERENFLKIVCEILPYISDKDSFGDFLKQAIKTNSLVRLDYNCLVHDIKSTKDTRLLTSEGYQHIFFKYQQEFNQLIISTSELEGE